MFINKLWIFMHNLNVQKSMECTQYIQNILDILFKLYF